MSKHFLVTGGAGFIGSNLVERLLQQGHRVRVLDNFDSGRRENLEEFSDDVELIEGDLRDLDTVKKSVQGVSVVLHQAALGSVPRSIEDPATTNDVNANGTLNMLLAARDADVERFVFASSSSIYGPTEELPKHEAMPPNPVSPYALSKYSGEKYCQLFYKLYGLPTVALRYFNIFGPRQDPNSQYAAVVPLFATHMMAGTQPLIFGDGEQSRDFTYIENAIQANLLAANSTEKAFGKVCNVGCGYRITLNELAQNLADLIGVEHNPTYTEPRIGDVKHSLAAIEDAKSFLDYEPAIDITEGLKRTVDWYRAQLSTSSTS
jgi:UDP-glucose 4-epimerase